jgi:hypothetical protein
MGRAVDVPPRADVFNWIKGTYGRNIKELIFSPMGGGQVWNGQPHMYTGITRAMHWDHVHWAMRNGGIVPTNRFDSGGMLPTGVSMAINNTGRPEHVIPAVRGGDGAALLAAVQGLRGELRSLRGDVDHHGDNATIAGELRGLRYQLAAGGRSAGAAMQSDRRDSELGAWA